MFSDLVVGVVAISRLPDFQCDDAYGLLIFGALSVAANDLDLVRSHGLRAVLHLERNVLDQKGPDFVAKAVCVK